MRRKKPNTNKSNISNGEKSKGLGCLLNEAMQAATCLPMLSEIYDNFSRNFAHSLKDYLNEVLSIKVINFSPVAFGNYLETLKKSHTLGVFKLRNFSDKCGLIIFDNDLIYTFIEILFGGKQVDSKLKVLGRAFTEIECSMLQNIIQIIIDDLNNAFSKVVDAEFEFDRVENSIGSALIVKEAQLSNLLEMELTIVDNFTGKVSILIPNSTLEPYKYDLSKPIIPKKLPYDPKWFNHFEKVANNTRIKLRAEYTETICKLHDLKNLKIGSTMILNKLGHESWDLNANSIKIANVKPGQINDRLAVELVDDINTSKYRK